MGGRDFQGSDHKQDRFEVRRRDSDSDALTAGADLVAPSPLLKGGRGMTPGDILQLQQTHGNAAVQRLINRMSIGRPVIQRKPVVREGSTGDSVREVQQKLNTLGIAGEDGQQLTLTEDAIFGPLTQGAVRRFQQSRGISEDGVVGPQTWASLDAVSTTENLPWSENVGGVTYSMTSRYDWQVTPQQIHITVKMKFTGDNAPAVITRWFNAIKSTWNIFKAVDSVSGTSLDIVFDPIAVTGSEHNTIQIISGTGRSNAGQWYTDDANGVDMNNTVACHEFGHMVGLPDEYQLTHADFQNTTGVAADPGTLTASDGATAETVATELHTAIQTADDAGTVPPADPSDSRVAAIKGVISSHGLAQGDFSEAVIGAYASQNAGHTLVGDIVAHVPAANQWDVIEPFTHSGGGIMGDFYSHGGEAVNSADAAGHNHPIGTRHMAPFIAHIQTANPGTWEAQYK